MAEDDATGRATRKPRTAKKPPAKAAPAPARTAKTRAEGAAKAAIKPTKESATKSEAETVAAPDVEAAKPPPPGFGPRRPMGLPSTKGLLGGLAAVAVLAALVLAWPGVWDRLAGRIAGPEPIAPVAAPKPAAPIPAADVTRWAKLADRLSALEESVTRLGGDIGALKSTPAEGMQAFDRRLAALEAGAGGRAVTDSALAGIEKRLAALTESLKALEDRRAAPPLVSDTAGTLALLALAGALRRGTPHGALAARVRAAIPKSNADGGFAVKLDALVGYETKGVPSLAALSARLEALPRPVTQAAPPLPKATHTDGGLWERVTRRLNELVVIRRVGEVPQPEPAARDRVRLAASRAMAAGDVVGALAALENMRGPDIVAWRRDAQARLQADTLAEALDAMIARRLGHAATAP
jgi:hypothetical protein